MHGLLQPAVRVILCWGNSLLASDLSVGILPLRGTLQDGWMPGAAVMVGGYKKTNKVFFLLEDPYRNKKISLQAALDSHAVAAPGCVSGCWVPWLPLRAENSQCMREIQRN